MHRLSYIHNRSASLKGFSTKVVLCRLRFVQLISHRIIHFEEGYLSLLQPITYIYLLKFDTYLQNVYQR